MNNYHYLLKLILVGDTCKSHQFHIQGAGKSCLLFQFTNSSFKQNYDVTLGVEFENKNIMINDKTIRLQVWDTAGQEAYKSITRSYYRGSIGAIVVFDVTSRQAFESLQVWQEEIYSVNNENSIQKALHHLLQTQISTEEAQTFAKNNQFAYFETSAKTGENVHALFESIAKTILDKIVSKEIDPYQEQYGIKVGSLVENEQKQQALTQNVQIPKPQSLNENAPKSNKKVENKEDGCC